MTAALRVTVRFLQRYSHGRGEDGLPEWPPSPLRLFQAMVASGIGREVIQSRKVEAADALHVLERIAPPDIVAPPVAKDTTTFRLYVPNNVGDLVAQGRAGVKERTEKDVSPLRLQGEAVHYLFAGNDELTKHVHTIRRIARSLTHLGWGIDQVVGDVGEPDDTVKGERWHPVPSGGTQLRIPTTGTLAALEDKHDLFLRRLEGGAFHPVPALTTFATHAYARTTDLLQSPVAAFRMLDPISGEPLWLDPARRSRDVAAWMRHATGETCARWPFGSVGTIVHGHGNGFRFSYLPLPTINPRLRRVEGIRRVLVSCHPELRPHIGWLRPRLGGRELMWREEVVAVLEPLPSSDWVLRQYVEPSFEWVTVTPVILPGHDDRASGKAERLLEKAFLHAGISQEVAASLQVIELRKTGFLPGTEHVARYLTPDKVSGPMFHARVRFVRPFPGPLAIGSGRHRGLGLFVGVDKLGW